MPCVHRPNAGRRRLRVTSCAVRVAVSDSTMRTAWRAHLKIGCRPGVISASHRFPICDAAYGLPALLAMITTLALAITVGSWIQLMLGAGTSWGFAMKCEVRFPGVCAHREAPNDSPARCAASYRTLFATTLNHARSDTIPSTGFASALRSDTLEPRPRYRVTPHPIGMPRYKKCSACRAAGIEGSKSGRATMAHLRSAGDRALPHAGDARPWTFM